MGGDGGDEGVVFVNSAAGGAVDFVAAEDGVGVGGPIEGDLATTAASGAEVGDGGWEGDVSV